jgi:hypothetical protein
MVGAALKLPWALIWLAVLAGFGLVILVLQRTRMARFYGVLAEHWARTGDMAATFDENGMELTQRGAEMRFGWTAVDAMVPVRGATVFRIGMTMITVPDRTLPDGLTGEAFRARIDGWRCA